MQATAYLIHKRAQPFMQDMPGHPNAGEAARCSTPSRCPLRRSTRPRRARPCATRSSPTSPPAPCDSTSWPGSTTKRWEQQCVDGQTIGKPMPKQSTMHASIAAARSGAKRSTPAPCPR
eukprot:1064314-Prymnesium_polylepis.1